MASKTADDPEEEGDDEYSSNAIVQVEVIRRKRGLGQCKICNQYGHYRKTCPQLQLSSTADNALQHLASTSEELSSTELKPKKSKHPKFISNYASASYTQMKDEDDDDSSAEDENGEVGHVDEENREALAMSNDDNNLIANQLLWNNSQGSTSHIDQEGSVSRRWGSWKKDVNRFVGHHFPLLVKDERREDGKIKDCRHRCKWVTCKRKSKFKCLTCEVFLCIGADDATNCFALFHTAHEEVK